MPDEVMNQLVECARAETVALLDYRKPGSTSPTRRWVEPYKLVQSLDAARCLRGYQIKADWAVATGWKLFRVDRIAQVADTGEVFKPRARITLKDGEVHGVFTDEPVIMQPSPEQTYADFVRTIVMDGVLSDAEFNSALALQENMNPEHVRAAHGGVYASLLTAMLVDGSISDEEQRHLREVRECLGHLGWAP